MPGMVAFNRRWSVGSDDFVLASAVLGLLHAFLFVSQLAALTAAEKTHRTQCVVSIQNPTIGHLVTASVLSVIELFITFISSRGTIVNATPRKKIGYFLAARLVLVPAELFWTIIGVTWLIKHLAFCPASLTVPVVLVTVFNGVNVVGICLAVLAYFDPDGRLNGVRNYEGRWQKRVRYLFCCLPATDKSNNSFSEVGKLFADFFRDIDVVPTDVIAGLLLLRRKQLFDPRATLVESGTRFLEPNFAPKLEELIHYMKYSLAIYGWPFRLKTAGLQQLCCLCPWQPAKDSRRITNPAGESRRVLVKDDNCFGGNLAAFDGLFAKTSCQLVYVTYRVAIEEPPFLIVIDHEKKAVVVAIRGTLSLSDIVTDLNGDSVSLPIYPARSDWKGHRGIVQSAAYLERKLVGEKLLKEAFDFAEGNAFAQAAQFRLVIVGHSLGAGVAAVLGILLKERYPTLHCYCFAPPGGLLTRSAADFTKHFVTTVALGKDIVPRLGLPQLESLRKELVEVVRLSQEPKWRIVGKALCWRKYYSVPNQSSIATVSEAVSEGSPFNRRDLRNHTSPTVAQMFTRPLLFPPGKILHLVRYYDDPKKKSTTYKAAWTDWKQFQTIIISSQMLNDHWPDAMLKAMQMLAESWKQT